MTRVSIFVLIVLVAMLSACQQSGRVKQAHADRVKLAEVNTELGIQYMQRGEYEIAVQKFDKAIEADPSYADTYNAYGLLHSRLGQFDDAERSFQHALRLDPSDSATLNNYGQFLCKRERYAEGQKRFLEAVENPLYKYPAVAYSNAGTCAMAAGDLEVAETHFRAALERDPRLAQALMQMIDLSFRHARYLPARGYLQRYLEVGRHSARTLWLGIQVERELGDKNAVSSYGLQLEKNFPDANETRLYLDSKTP